MSINVAQEIIETDNDLPIGYRICNEELNKEECDFDFNDCCNFFNFQPNDLKDGQKQWYEEDEQMNKARAPQNMEGTLTLI